jgi:transcriptional regulator with XRE-family HTH domain
MTLAQRVRDSRYAKGWGPDELASRAAISRTALYQIECGKTEVPRAGTLRRIAEALDVPVDALIRGADLLPAAAAPPPRVGPEGSADAEGWSLQTPGERRASSSLEALDLVAGETISRLPPHRSPARQRQLDRMFRELLASPLGEGVARIVEESYRLLPSLRERRSAQ